MLSNGQKITSRFDGYFSTHSSPLNPRDNPLSYGFKGLIDLKISSSNSVIYYFTITYEKEQNDTNFS